MSNANNNNAHQLYGMAYQKLQTVLFKQRKYGEMRLSSYLSTRMGIEGWTFSAADIAHQTGLNRHSAYTLCDLLQKVGIFIVKDKRVGETTRYTFDERALKAYVEGSSSLADLSADFNSRPLPGCSSTTPGISTTTLPGCSMTTPWLSSDHQPGHSPTTPWSTSDHLPGWSLTTINKNEKKDENENEKYIHTNRAYVSISDSPCRDTIPNNTETKDVGIELERDAKAKAESFLEQAKRLQAEDSTLGITITSNALIKLQEMFVADPSLTVKEVGTQWYEAISHAVNARTLISVNDPLNYQGTKLERGEYDDRFWFKRSCDLTFFIKNRANVVASLNQLHN